MTEALTNEQMKLDFWKEMAKSPYVLLQLDEDSDSVAPMTAQLDKDANSAIWFFTGHDNRFATLGPATAGYASKGHELFARFHGVLSKESDQAVFDAHWSNTVAAWFPEGKESALMLRMDLGDASIWDPKMGALTVAKMKFGMDVTTDVPDKIETTL